MRYSKVHGRKTGWWTMVTGTEKETGETMNKQEAKLSGMVLRPTVVMDAVRPNNEQEKRESDNDPIVRIQTPVGFGRVKLSELEEETRVYPPGFLMGLQAAVGGGGGDR